MKIILNYIKDGSDSSNMEFLLFNINIFKPFANKFYNIPYFIDESEKKLEILTLKQYLSKKFKIEKELITISLNPYITNNFRGIPDNFNVLREKGEKGGDSIEMTHVHSEKEKDFYYKINHNIPLIKIIIEINIDNNIKNLSLNVPGSCTMYMLKSNLAEDLSILTNSIELKNIKSNNRYNDEDYLSDAHSEFINRLELINSVNSFRSVDSDSFNNDNNEPVFKIKLIQKLLKTKSKGINFFFNYMNEINKMKFQETAPDYREASDGINILFYCENPNCLIFNEMFIHKLGKIKLLFLILLNFIF
jgi:hypothetical protein